MEKRENKRVWVNRIMSFVFGGLLVFAVMSLAVTAPVKSQNKALAMELDEIQYGAVRLLDEANAFVLLGSYDKAMGSLDSLFEKHPASSEAAEGAVIYTGIEVMLQEKESKWDAAVGKVKTAWENTRADEIRSKSEKERLTMETAMSEKLAVEWEESKAKVRKEWEKL